MKKIRSYVAAALVGIAAFSFVGCNMIEKTPEAIQKTVLAKIGDEKITKGDLDSVIQVTLDSLKEQYGDDFENNAEIKDQLLEFRKRNLTALVEEKVLMNKAKELDLIPTDEELNKEVDDRVTMIKGIAGTEEQFLALLQSNYGMKSEEEFRETLKKQVIIGKVVEKMTEGIEVTDEEIEAKYNENIASYQKQPGAEAFNILLSKDKYTEQDAIDVRNKIVNGEATFEEMAEKYNEDSTKTTGGSLGYVTFENSGMVAEFEAALKTLKEGEISQPVKSEKFGWHIIKVKNIKTEPFTTPLEEVKEEIKSTLLEEKQTKAYDEKLEEYKKEANVKLYESRL